MTLRQCLFGLVAAGVLAGFAACSGGDKPAATSTPGTPEATSTAQGVPCPVDIAICELARTLESEARAGTVQSLLPGAIGERVQNMLGAPGGVPRVTSIGCPATDGRQDCSRGFAIAITSLPDDLVERDTRGLEVVFFSPGNPPLPYALFEAPDPAERRLFVDGGERDFDAGVDRDGTMPHWRFVPFDTGAGPGTPETVELGPPRQVSGARTVVMTLGEPYSIQQGEAWYFKYLCDACGPGPLPNLYRAYRASDGTLVVDDLKQRTESLGQAAAFTADWKRGTAYLVTCEPGRNCYSLESADAESTADATVFKSEDGGITWKRDGSVPPLTSLSAAGGQVLATTYEPHFENPRYWFYPNGPDLELPQNVTAEVFPEVLNTGTVVWRDREGQYYDQAGGTLFGPLFAENYRPNIAATDLQYLENYLTWAESTFKVGWEQQPFYWYVGHIDRNGQMKDLYALPGDTLWISGQFPRSGGEPSALFGRFRFGTSKDYVRDVSFGAVLDLKDGTVHRFAELDGARPPGTFAWMEDLKTTGLLEHSPGRAPFYRVTGAGDCLNVRESPSLSARVLACIADDVLLGGVETPDQSNGGVTWRQVHTPGGQLGWASAEFLR